MKKTHWLTVLLIFLANIVTAQDKEFRLSGFVKDSLGSVADVHLVNLRTKDGSLSNDFGQFAIPVKKGDSILISSVRHYEVFYVVTAEDHQNRKINIYLKNNTYELDEVVVKNNKLSGTLSVDATKRQVTRDETKESELQKMIAQAKRTSSLFKLLTGQPLSRDLAGVSSRLADPTRLFAGMGGGIGLGYGKDKEKIQLAFLEKNNDFYNKIESIVSKKLLNELGIEDFRIRHFLLQCDQKKLSLLTNNNRQLDLIQYLKKQSAVYLKNIAENK